MSPSSAAAGELCAGGLKAAGGVLEELNAPSFVAVLGHEHLSPAVVVSIEDVEDEAQMFWGHLALEQRHAQPGRWPQVGLNDLDRLFATHPQRHCETLPSLNGPFRANEVERHTIGRELKTLDVVAQFTVAARQRLIDLPPLWRPGTGADAMWFSISSNTRQLLHQHLVENRLERPALLNGQRRR